MRAVSKANKSLLHTCLKCESAPKKNWQEILSLEFPPGKGGRGREGVEEVLGSSSTTSTLGCQTHTGRWVMRAQTCHPLLPFLRDGEAQKHEAFPLLRDLGTKPPLVARRAVSPLLQGLEGLPLTLSAPGPSSAGLSAPLLTSGPLQHQVGLHFHSASF